MAENIWEVMIPMFSVKCSHIFIHIRICATAAAIGYTLHWIINSSRFLLVKTVILFTPRPFACKGGGAGGGVVKLSKPYLITPLLTSPLMGRITLKKGREIIRNT